MESFTLSGRELFDGFPEPVFWTLGQQLSYWNQAAVRLCRSAGEGPPELGLPAFLSGLPEECCLTQARIAGQIYDIQIQPVSGGWLYVLRMKQTEGVLSRMRIADLMQRMRAPMGSMYAAMQQLDGEEGPMQMLNRNYCRLLRLVEEVELAQQLDGEGFVPAILDLAGLCRSVIRQVQGAAGRQGPTICYEEERGSILVRGEDRLLRHLLYHMLSNAWQAAGAEGSITVRLSVLGRRARLSVSDSGAGMAPAALGTAFDPEETASLTGAGLGLALCQRIAQLHGGSLMLKSGETGTTAACSLPVVRETGGVLCTPSLNYQVEQGIPEVLVALADVLPLEAYDSQEMD